MTSITCNIELGSWTIRVNGYVVQEFRGWSAEKHARRVAMNLGIALNCVVTYT